MNKNDLIYPNRSQNLGEGKRVISEVLVLLIEECNEDISRNNRRPNSWVRRALNTIIEIQPNPLAFDGYELMQTIAKLSDECGWESRLSIIGWVLVDLHKDLNQLSRLLDGVDFRILQVNIEHLKTSSWTENGNARRVKLSV